MFGYSYVYCNGSRIMLPSAKPVYRVAQKIGTIFVRLNPSPGNGFFATFAGNGGGGGNGPQAYLEF